MDVDPYLDAPLGALLDELASERPAPGGGSAAAACGAMAACLVAKAARRSRKEWEHAGGAAAQAATLRARLAPLIHLDAAAFADALVALAPGANLRAGPALAWAADIPAVIAGAAGDVAALAAEVAEHGRLDARVDLAAAADLAAVATRVACLLVEVNLTTAPGDSRLRDARAAVTAAEAASARVRAGVM